MSPATPRYDTLSEADARALLARHRVGRIAYTLHDRVDIEPVHFISDGDWIFGRTSVGTKLATLSHHPWCAFEVDEVHAVFEWKSVVAKGSFHHLDPETGSADTYARALELLRRVMPSTFSDRDPAPHRTIVFGIHVNEITGRAATLGPE
ncbi:MAG: Pyridoxamine 5-phosphate oxidase-related protein [Gemmatimonadetes bacterium]|jgi:nitroimidazol reductase NimA-like FMN-containing flavoprotein (pyridoxamine 5'-phosphate oxidase superfamily)|nr:Pyridoxamine 5-phosphate oxidase-related protein [Gemmatimonadota bacterium]